MVAARLRTWLADPVAGGAVAAAVLGVIEAVRIVAAGRPALLVTLAAVFAVTGGLAGAAIAATRALADRWHLARWPAAALVAAPSLLVWIPLGRSLFEGAYAATLPGASLGPVAVPVLGWLAVSVAVAVADLWAGTGTAWRDAAAGRVRRASLAIALVGAALVVDVINRSMFRSGYPDIHLALALIGVVAAGRAVAVVVGGPPPRPRVRLATGLAMVAVAVAAAGLGLSASADRARVATYGGASRDLVRAARSLIDLDRDGYSFALGGGDCDEGDPARHAGARDLPGNGVDEDCDGADAVVPVAHVDPEAVRSLAEWRAGPEVGAVLDRTRDMNLVIISVDALRADVVAPGDPRRASLPHLAGLLDRSVWFQRAQAPAAGTDVSLSSFVTGRWNPFQPIARTLPEALADTGRLTHAVLPREVLRYAPETLLTRGLSSLDRVITDGSQRDVGDRVSAPETTDHALAFLDRAGDRRFALWVHYFDVHEHRQIPLPDEALAAIDDRGGAVARKYRALAALVDGEVGRLLGELDRRGLSERTIVVLFSDHGESLGEDPRLPDAHGVVVYQALTHVPLAIHVPGVAARAALEPVSLVDVAPTVAALLGAGGLAEVDGVDLLPDVLAAPEPLGHHDRALVMNEQEQWAVLAWPYKLLVRPADDLTELYDLAADPHERHDLAGREPELVKQLRARYGGFPAVPMDRTRKGRQWRERQARPPRPPATP